MKRIIEVIFVVAALAVTNVGICCPDIKMVYVKAAAIRWGAPLVMVEMTKCQPTRSASAAFPSGNTWLPGTVGGGDGNEPQHVHR